MSSRGSRESPLRRNQRRKVMVNLDLSIGLPGQAAVEVEVESFSGVNAQTVQPVQQENAPVLIDVEAFDNEVLISSPRAFAEARNNSRRSRVSNVVVHVDSEEQTARFANCYKRRGNMSSRRPLTLDQVIINLENSCDSKKDKCVEQPQIVPPPPPPPPPEPAFSCPICMGELVEEMTTKCGHIFCKKCIQTAISKKSICPTCRKSVNKKDIIRIYLPTTK